MRNVHHIRLVVLLPLVLLSAQIAQADTITFNDLTDSITITQVGSTLSGNFVFLAPLQPCGTDVTNGEKCTGLMAKFPSAALVSTTLPQTLWIGGIGGMISDVFQNNIGASLGAGSFFYGFFSDNEAGTLGPSGSLSGPCSATPIGGCQMIEDGTVQIAGTVTWSDGSTDTIQFQSGVDDVDGPSGVVPEPSSILLLLTGFAGLGFTKLRGKVASRFCRAF